MAHPGPATLVLGLLVLLAGCVELRPGTSSSSPPPTTSRPPTTSPPPSSAPSSSPPASSSPSPSGPPPLSDVARTFELTSYSITPATLSVANNTRLRVTAHNGDVAQGAHNWHVEVLDRSTDVVNPGEDATVDVEIRRTGSFRYWCEVGNHRALGMEGTLTVTA